MYDRNGVRLSLIHALPVAAEASGTLPGPVLALGGLEPDALLDHERVVRRAQIITVLNGLARKSGDATLGLRMAAATDPNLLGPFGRSHLVGRTLREALFLQQRHMPWLQQGVSIRMEMAGQVVLWSHRMIGPDPAEARFLTEGIAAFVVRFLRAATGEPEARVHVVLPHRPIAPISVHEDSLQATVSFAPGDALEVRFDAALLDRRNRLRGDSGETPSALRSGALAESAELSDDQLLASLGHMVEATVMGARVNLAEAAHALGMSPRGLQRRLARLEMSFERIVDDWRHDQALQLLRDPSAGTSEVAYRLGYADPSHFIRAFRRWRGVSPMAFRRSLA